MEPSAYSLPVGDAGESASSGAARWFELKCPVCGVAYVLLVPADARYPDQTYRNQLMWRMGMDCPGHAAAVVWDAEFVMPTAIWSGRESASPVR